MEEVVSASVGGEAPVSEGLVVNAPVAPAPAPPSEPNEKGYLERMQEAVSKFDAGDGTLEEQAAQVAESVSSDAPVSGDSTDETQDAAAPSPGGEVTDQSPVEPERAKIDIPYDQLPDNMRAELRRANLAPEVKEALAQSWYERKAFHDVGFTVDQARQLKSVGFTPESANDRLRIHPTVDDAATDAHLANVARTLINDFASNPESMLDGLRSNAPDAFPQFAGVVAEKLPDVAPEAYHRLASRAMYNALRVLESQIDENDFDAKEKVEFVLNKIFPQATGTATGKRQGEFNPDDPIHQKYKAMEDQQRQQAAHQAVAFQQAAVQYGQQAVASEISRRVSEALPKGVAPSVVQRATGEIMQMVASDFMSNRGIIASLDQMATRSDLSQEALNNLVQQAYNRALPLIAVHAKPVLDFWSQNLRTNEQPPTPALRSPQRPTNSQTVANSPSAQKIPGASAPPPNPAAPPTDFIARGRKQGWDTGKIISAWLSGQR